VAVCVHRAEGSLRFGESGAPAGRVSRKAGELRALDRHEGTEDDHPGLRDELVDPRQDAVEAVARGATGLVP
jgi:hypothetical protein